MQGGWKERPGARDHHGTGLAAGLALPKICQTANSRQRSAQAATPTFSVGSNRGDRKRPKKRSNLPLDQRM
jgi:hypothetical protein